MLASTIAGTLALSVGALPLQPVLPGMPPHDPSATAALLSELPSSSLAGQGKNGGPFVAPSWVADVEQLFGAGTLGTGKGTYAYDRVGQRWRIKTVAENTLFHTSGDKMYLDQLGVNLTGKTLLNMNTTAGEGENSVCKAFPGPYYDLLSALAYSQPGGSGSVGGEPCDIWSLANPAMGFSLYACMGSDGVPRQLNMSTGIAYKAASSQNYTFSNPRVGPLSDEVFANSDACANRYPMPPCPGGEEVSLTMYRTHSSKEPRSLRNRNLGGALGDMAFFCDLAGTDETSLVTKWAVRANSSWGQYGYCLFSGDKNVCHGNTGKHVGRESALGLGEGAVQGQCSANQDVGSWYAFPAEGECKEGAAIGTEGCTWTATAVRSVSAGCIVKDRGLAEACAKDRGHAPMKNSAAIFMAALESADPEKGGCPDAAPTGEVVLAV